MRRRIIPAITWSGGDIVKTKAFRKPRYVGDPYNLIRIFSEKEADEILFLDIDATDEGRGPDLKLVEDIAALCTAPLTYGGGITTVRQIGDVLRLGVEKVVIGAAANAATGGTFLEEAVAAFGSSTIAACVDYSHRQKGSPAGIIPASKALKYAQSLEARGAGEIVLHCADLDGGGEGYDIPLLKEVAAMVTVPVVALGGACGAADIEKLFAHTRVSAAAAGWGMIYLGPHRAVLPSYPAVAGAAQMLL